MVPKDNGHFGCGLLVWLICTPIALVAACLVLFGSGPERIFFAIWGSVWALVAVVIPYQWLGRWWAEWIEVSASAVTHGRRGLLATRPRTFPLRPGMVVAIGPYHFGEASDDSRVKLALVWPSNWGGRRRAELGMWLAPAAKEEVFGALAAFVEEQRLPLELKRFDR